MKQAQEQERHTVKQTNLQKQQDGKSKRVSFFFPSAFPRQLSDKHSLPWQALSLAPFPCLSYVVSEHQPSFAPRRELQASVTLSYTQCIKTRQQANGHRSVQNQVKCWRLHLTLSDCYVWRAEADDLKGRKDGIISTLTSNPPTPIVFLRSAGE